MLEDGNKNRTQHPTDANATSSRSHAVFQVRVCVQHLNVFIVYEYILNKLLLIRHSVKVH